jgi:hypothetical protein
MPDRSGGHGLNQARRTVISVKEDFGARVPRAIDVSGAVR